MATQIIKVGKKTLVALQTLHAQMNEARKQIEIIVQVALDNTEYADIDLTVIKYDEQGIHVEILEKKEE